MTWKQWFSARVLIVSGFFVTFVATIVTCVWFLSDIAYAHPPVTDWIQEIAIPLASLSTFIAWWFLTKISVSSTGRGDLFRKAFLALALESLLLCIANVMPLIQYFHFNWLPFGDLLYAVGTFTTACGFFLIARRYSSNSNDNQDATAFDRVMAEGGDNIPLEQVKHELGWS
ncbi:MAG TPA: hypothetical protein VII67_07965 [Acidimicrobiales bacterium]